MEASKHGEFFRLHKNQVFYVLGLISICVGVYLAVRYVPQLFLKEQKRTTPPEIMAFLKTSNPAQPAPAPITETLRSSETKQATPAPGSVVNFLKK